MYFLTIVLPVNFTQLASRSLVLLGLFALAAAGQTTHAASPAKMNLLIIQTDEHNFRTLGCYRKRLPREQALMWGEAVVETPNIDWIAQQGAICTSFYATTPVCSPSRAALVSGRYPQNTPVVTNNIPLDDDIVTFAEILRRQGYATGFAGKWHLDGPGKPQWAPKRKFGFEDNRYMYNRGHWKQLEVTADGPRVAARDNGGNPSYSISGATKENFTTDFLANKTVDFIEANASQPFCFWLSLPDPHGPDSVRAPYDTMFADQSYQPPRTYDKPATKLPSWGQPQGGGYGQDKYYGMVRCIDDNVGKIIDSLRQQQILEQTIIVFTSDHGDLRGEHHRQNKGVPYEGSARVPFLIYCPGKIPADTVIDQALTCVDFQPTVLRLLEQEPCGQEEGRDASALFLAKDSPEEWEDVAFVRGTGSEKGWLAAVTDRFKLVVSSVDPPWLLDLERDPDEVTNFFEHAGYREIVQALATSLRDYGRKHNDPFLKSPRIAGDIEWSIKGTGTYQPPAAPPTEPQAEPQAEPKKNRRKRKQAN